MRKNLTLLILLIFIGASIFPGMPGKSILNTAIDPMDSKSIGCNMNDIYPEVLWNNSADVGLSYLTPIYSLDINNDGYLDVFVNHSALDGKIGTLIWHTTTGDVCGIGDINNDGKDEVFTKEEGESDLLYSLFYCLNAENGTILWQHNLSCTWIQDIAVGNITGDATNEVIVPTQDAFWRNNQFIYCLDGPTGEKIWEKYTTFPTITAKIADINHDGKNETLVSRWEHILYCLAGNGSSIWEISNVDTLDYRTICIGDLNQDPYNEIILESHTYNVSGPFDGVRCISGKNGSTLWTWYQEPDAGVTGSFQSMIIADMISSIPGNEVIAGGVCGLYCLKGDDSVSSDEREIWHAGISNGILPDIVMSADVGELDNDGRLDVAAITTYYPNTYAIDGQEGTLLWKINGCGTEDFHAIITTNLPGAVYSMILAKDDSYVIALKTNEPPVTPTINGPTSGKINETLHYTAATIDSDTDNISYFFDWGDGSSSGWTFFVPSGISVNMSHNWSKHGTYHITVKARDVHGEESDWSPPVSVTIDKPPNTPTLSGPGTGKPGTMYLFVYQTTDPDEDNIFYYIDWGDNQNSSWLGPCPSGVQQSASHSWSEKGTYIIKIKAKDIWGAESAWGTLQVSMPFSYKPHNFHIIESLLEHFPNAFPILRYLLGCYE